MKKTLILIFLFGLGLNINAQNCKEGWTLALNHSCAGGGTAFDYNPAMNIYACVEDEKNNGSQHVFWTVETFFHHYKSIKFTKTVYFACGTTYTGTASLYNIQIGQVVDQSDGTLWNYFTSSDCNNSNRIVSVSVSNITCELANDDPMVIQESDRQKKVEEEKKSSATKAEKEKEYHELVKEGDQLMNDKKYAEAENKYNEAHELCPDFLYAKEEAAKAKNLKEKEEGAEAKKSNSQNSQQESSTSNGNDYTPSQNEIDRGKSDYHNKMYQDQQKANQTDRILLAALWIGFYTFNTPENDIYESSPSRFFSIGPTNSCILIPTYNNVYYKDETPNGPLPDLYDTEAGNIITANFGMKMEFGEVWDGFQFSIPLRGNLGLFTDNFSDYSGSAGINTFFGAPSWKNFKFGFCMESGIHEAAHDGYFNFTSDFGISETWTQANCSFTSNTFKFGFRVQSHFSSRDFDPQPPFVFDLFFTTTKITDNTSNLGYSILPGSAIGAELNISKLGSFGFFAKVINMSPVGNVLYAPESGLTIGAKRTPYFEVGVKKEYTWFKAKKK
ncbi:hypothetical protein BH09BAC5_BH09BAC5_01400 [soil metagenome]